MHNAMARYDGQMRSAVEKLACTAIKCKAGEFDPVEEFSEIIRFNSLPFYSRN